MSQNPERPWAVRRALLLGMLIVGTLDMLDALIFFGLRGVPPFRIPQSIASGLIGKAAFAGGAGTVVLGTLLHYFIAFGIVAVYLAASRRIANLARRPLLYGPLYGLVVYFVMNVIVVPLSAAANNPKPVPVLVNGLLIHMLGVGIPAAVVAAKASRSSAR